MSITVAQKKVHKEFIFISWGVKNVFKIDDLAFQLHFKCDSVNQFTDFTQQRSSFILLKIAKLSKYQSLFNILGSV